MDSGFIIAVGTAMLLMMTVFIVSFVAYYQQKQVRQQLTLKELQEKHRIELMRATFRGQEVERRRLASDLHDDIGTMLSVTKMSLNALDRHVRERPGLDLMMHKTRSLIDQTMTNVRRISRDLVPTTLDRFGLIAALEELAERATDGEFIVNLECPETLLKLSASLELTLYRIAQELVNNAIKHAFARHITIRLICFDDAIRLSVIDDGRGFDMDKLVHDKGDGLGLLNIESRLSVMDGYVTFDVAPGRGSQIHIQIKLKDQQPVYE